MLGNGRTISPTQPRRVLKQHNSRPVFGGLSRMLRIPDRASLFWQDAIDPRLCAGFAARAASNEGLQHRRAAPSGPAAR